MAQLEDRIAIVTGGTGALGRAVVELFAQRGARVAVPYIVDDEAGLLRERLGDRFPDSQIKLFKTDLGDPEAVGRMAGEVIQAWGAIDILAHLVGGVLRAVAQCNHSVAVVEVALIRYRHLGADPQQRGQCRPRQDAAPVPVHAILQARIAGRVDPRNLSKAIDEVSGRISLSQTSSTRRCPKATWLS